MTDEKKAEHLATIKQLLDDGQTIQAIKLVRALTDGTLKDSYTFVNNVRDGKPVTWPGVPVVEKPVMTRARWRAIVEDAYWMTLHGNRVSAIKLLRNETGCTLKLAYDATKRFKQVRF